jgi:hypothetical protein
MGNNDEQLVMIQEQGDLGLGITEVSEEDAKKVKDNQKQNK